VICYDVCYSASAYNVSICVRFSGCWLYHQDSPRCCLFCSRRHRNQQEGTFVRQMSHQAWQNRCVKIF